ncbi:MAG: nucleoside triphosphate pyrophosphohydrolase [Ruminococcus sp.]|jgi:tetrapyrrole methylase family protein/MazG family protein|nr:nucleoside triphosphate pyrophosphohydrolase [Ruminococcus sp.]
MAEKSKIGLDICSKMCYNAIDLCEIVKILRSENGCPWDKEQTHISIKSDFLEETCEVIEAIENDDKALLKEELGDVLLQVVFHSQIAAEDKDFDFGDVCSGICRKLIERHPHVFGELKLDSSDEVLKNWDKIKKDTKGQTYTDTLKSVTRTLPALMRAEKVGKRAARAGMDFPDALSALESLESEVAEFREEFELLSDNKNSQMNDINQDRLAEELGDVLFSAVNVARKTGFSAEELLGKAITKFILRFEKVEESAKAVGISMENSDIETLDKLWEKAK